MTLGAKGFTLLEGVMIVLLLSGLIAITVPNLRDFKSDANNAATQGALGQLRSAIEAAHETIVLREKETALPFPTLEELKTNRFLPTAHPALAGSQIMGALPRNPWSSSEEVVDCGSLEKSMLRSDTPGGWCYQSTTGQLWANSDRNGQKTTENNY